MGLTLNLAKNRSSTNQSTKKNVYKKKKTKWNKEKHKIEFDLNLEMYKFYQTIEAPQTGAQIKNEKLTRK